jgi:hypothetical protein
VLSSRRKAARRQEFVATYELPKGIGQDLKRELGESAEMGIAFKGFRQWLRLHVAAPGMLAMPSRAVDTLWHDFILHTEAYQDFCHHAYGRTLHHSPGRSLDAEDSELSNGEGIGRTFAMACQDQGIRLPSMAGIPVLFSVDTELAIPGGLQWILDCGRSTCAANLPVHCIRHQVRPFIPKHLPLQRDPSTGRWLIPRHEEFSLGGGATSAYNFPEGPTCGGHG